VEPVAGKRIAGANLAVENPVVRINDDGISEGCGLRPDAIAVLPTGAGAMIGDGGGFDCNHQGTGVGRRESTRSVASAGDVVGVTAYKGTDRTGAGEISTGIGPVRAIAGCAGTHIVIGSKRTGGCEKYSQQREGGKKFRHRAWALKIQMTAKP